MFPITYTAVTVEGQAIDAAHDSASAFIAGGTTLLDLMKLNVENPHRLIDINALPLSKIESLPDGSLRIGAMVRNSDLAYHPAVREKYRVLSEALLSGASAQLRNMATTGGNLMQRTRCYYFRDVSYPCNQREAGSGCSALDGYNRMHAVLGTSDKCIATHPSDMCVALSALDAIIRIRGDKGERTVPINEFYVAYGDDPPKQTVLQHGELITALDLSAPAAGTRSHYLKVRDRASYEFALASAAVVVEMNGATIRNARIALGGVATKPWRATDAEKILAGAKPSPELFARAGEIALREARPQKFNGFKIELAKRVISRALATVTGESHSKAEG